MPVSLLSSLCMFGRPADRSTSGVGLLALSLRSNMKDKLCFSIFYQLSANSDRKIGPIKTGKHETRGKLKDETRVENNERKCECEKAKGIE